MPTEAGDEAAFLLWLVFGVLVILGIGIVSLLNELRLWWRGGP